MALSNNGAVVIQDYGLFVTIVLVIACFSSCTYLEHKSIQDTKQEEIRLEQKQVELQILKEQNNTGL